MRIVAFLVLGIGVALAGGSVWFLSDYYGRYQAMLASQSAGPETVRVIAAKKPLKYGDRVSLAVAGERLEWVTWPKSAVPAGAFTDAAELLGEDRKATRTVLRTIEPGELLLRSKLTGFGGTVRVATQVAEGMRAYTIPIDAVSGVAGLIAPGDRVDILLTRSIDQDLVTTIILQNVMVIATDQMANPDARHGGVARTATVEVDPTAASKLALAQQVGKLSLSLRGVDEGPEAAVAPVRIGDLPAQPQAPEMRPAPVRHAPTIVRVRKGAEVQDVPVK